MQPIILVVIDGFGLSPISEGNAILAAKTPFIDWAIQTVPKAMLHASGDEVGLEWGEMGNSEVGHLNIGTGRIVMQNLPRIDRAIEDETFFSNQVMKELSETLRKDGSTLHIIGLASTGGVHAHLNHMLAMLEFAKREKLTKVALHLIADGRDTPPQTLIKDLSKIEAAIKKTGVGTIATISGRYFAMDRDKRWDRIQKAYLAIVKGEGKTAPSATAALEQAATAKETDEFITPTVIVGSDSQPVAPITEKDCVVFTNYRPDRARQLSDALTAKEFTEFPRSIGPVKFFVSFTSYGGESTPQVKVAFFAPPTENQLADSIAKAGLTQFHIAETEKYAHVTYFFNGGIEKEFPKEERVLIPSPKVATYDLKPEMSAADITKQFIERLRTEPPIFSVINFANPDMVGHTGSLPATIKAVEAVDHELKTIFDAAKAIQATLLITADHGNAEELVNPETHEIDKEHSTNPVPLFIISPDHTFADTATQPDKPEQIAFAAQPPIGVLADVAPTILDLLELEKPADMTGQSLKGLL